MKTYSEIEGDGGSGIVAQVVDLGRRIGDALSDVRAVLAVASGKGGVGKSMVTRRLAEEMARRGRKIAILDADLNGPCQARMAGLTTAPSIPGPDGLALPRDAAGIGVASLGSLLPANDAMEFESVAEGDSHVWRQIREFTFLGQWMASVSWGALDVLFVDLPPGAERTFQYAEFLGPQASFVLVTTPSAMATEVVARSFDALRRTPNRLLGYVENMSGYWCADCNRIKPLFPEDPSAARLPAPCLGRIPFDPEWARAADRGLSGGREGGAASAAAAAAEEIARALVPEEDRP